MAIDQGTQSTRASILNVDGEVVAHASLPVAATRPGINLVEQDANELAESVESVIEQVLARVPKAVRSLVEVCGIATQRSTVLSWEAKGNNPSVAINWQDTRGQEQLASLRHNADEIQRCSGLPLSAHYGASKLHWLIHNAAPTKGRTFGPLSSYLLSRVSTVDTDLVDQANAQRTQLLDISTMEWSRSLADLFTVPVELLPNCCPIYHDYGELKGVGIPITAMNGDQNAAWFGSGLADADTALINMGSGAFILTPQPANNNLPWLLSTIAYSDKTTTSYLTEATINGAGNALQWLSERHHISDLSLKLESALEQTNKPALFLNTVGGLGSPWWRSGLEPQFLHDHGQYSEAEMIAGVCESILFLIYQNLLEIQQVKQLSELHLSGGLSQMDGICQRLADLTGLQVKRLRQSESTIRGIAWIASGQPESWGSSEYDWFQPRADNKLKSRFELFIDMLCSQIEGAGRG